MRRSVGQANVEEHPKGSGRWRARARIEGKLKNLISGVSHAEAIAVAEGYSVVRNDLVFKEGITLKQFGAGYLDRREENGSRDVRTSRNIWKNHIEADPISELPITSLSRPDVVEWLGRRKGPRQTRRNQLNLLRGALWDAVERGIINGNPARDVKVKKVDAEDQDDLRGILTPAEQQRLIAAVPEQWRALVIFALMTGVRQAEQWWLKPEDVSTTAITVRRSVGGKRPKGGKTRTLHLLEPAIRALASAPSNADWVWPAIEGGRRQQGKPPKGWHTWVKNAKIKRRIQWKDLRHTCATSLLAGWWGRKWTIDEVCQQLGHSSVKVTERYARKLAETLQLAVRQTEFPASSHLMIAPIANRGKKPGSRLRESNSRPAVYETAEHSNTRKHLGPSGFPVGNSGITLFPTTGWALAYAAESVLLARAERARLPEYVTPIAVGPVAKPRKVSA